MLWMEPDLRPIQRFWLQATLEEIAVVRSTVASFFRCFEHTSPQRETQSRSEFWMRGSLPRYAEQDDFHLNGNALYRFDDALFSAFVVGSAGRSTRLCRPAVDLTRVVSPLRRRFQAVQVLW